MNTDIYELVIRITVALEAIAQHLEQIELNTR